MPGSECVIIDPGMDAVAGVTELIMEHRLKPVAVMLTHGHLDHMCSVTPLCRSYNSTCWVHPGDRAADGPVAGDGAPRRGCCWSA